MKENMLDVLMFLFDNYWDMDKLSSNNEEDTLATELEQAGFPGHEIDKAFVWLEELVDLQAITPPNWPSATRAVRVFSEEEIQKIDIESRSLVLQLEQEGILDSWTREIIMDRVMAIDTQLIDIDEMHQIVDLVLMNHPNQDVTLAWEGLLQEAEDMTERQIH